MKNVILVTLFALATSTFVSYSAQARPMRAMQCEGGILYPLGNGKVSWQGRTYKIFNISQNLVGQYVIALSEPALNPATGRVEDYVDVSITCFK